MAVDEQQRRSSEIRLDITLRESHDFVKRLARDEAFRTALQERPQETLREYHIELPEESIPSQIELPSPKDVETLLAEMVELDEYGTTMRIWFPLGPLFNKIKEKIRRWRRR
jgi:hypothetical protein